MPRRYEQSLIKNHPDYKHTNNTPTKTNTLLENAIGSLKRGLTKTRDNLKSLNKAADDGLLGVMTHGTSEDTSDEAQIKKRWEGLGKFRQQSWEEYAENEADPIQGKLGARQPTGFEAFREEEIKTRKEFARPRKPVGYQKLPDGGTNSGDFDQYIQSEWDAMEDADKQRYSDFNDYLDMRKRTEQQRGGQS